MSYIAHYTEVSFAFESLYRRYMSLHVADGHVQTGDARLLIEEPGNL